MHFHWGFEFEWKFKWDEAKRANILDRHGLDFADVSRFEWRSAFSFPSKMIEGEWLDSFLGKLDDHVVYFVYEECEDIMTLISLRIATKAERAFYVTNS